MHKLDEILPVAREMRAAGKTFREIGDRFGFSHQRAAQILSPSTITARVKSTARKDRMEQRLSQTIRLLASGWTCAEISKELKIPLATLYAFAKSRGIILQERRRRGDGFSASYERQENGVMLSVSPPSDAVWVVRSVECGSAPGQPSHIYFELSREAENAA